MFSLHFSFPTFPLFGMKKKYPKQQHHGLPVRNDENMASRKLLGYHIIKSKFFHPFTAVTILFMWLVIVAWLLMHQKGIAIGHHFRGHFRHFRHKNPEQKTVASLDVDESLQELNQDSLIDDREKNRQSILKKARTEYISNFTFYDLEKKKSNRNQPSLKPLLDGIIDNQQHILFVTTGTMAYESLIRNWICNLNRLGISHYLVAAMDMDLYFSLVNSGITQVFYASSPFLHENLTSNITRANFGTSQFIAISRTKSLLVQHILRHGYHVLYSDPDVHLFRDPIPTLTSSSYDPSAQGLEYSTADILIQSDINEELVADTVASKNGNGPLLNENICSGFYLIYTSNRTVAALQAVMDYFSDSGDKRSEQKAFNFVFCGAFKKEHLPLKLRNKYGFGMRKGDHLCFNTNINLSVEVLDTTLFPNGSVGRKWFENKGWLQRNDQLATTTEGEEVSKDEPMEGPAIIHVNYAAYQEKIDRLKTAGFWYLENNGIKCVA